MGKVGLVMQSRLVMMLVGDNDTDDAREILVCGGCGAVARAIVAPLEELDAGAPSPVTI